MNFVQMVLEDAEPELKLDVFHIFLLNGAYIVVDTDRWDFMGRYETLQDAVDHAIHYLLGGI